MLTNSFGERLKGRVIDKDSGKPLFNVNIFLSGTIWGTTSDENGFYEISSVIPSDYQVVFSMIGYETESKTIIVKDNKIVELNVRMKSKTYELENVTVASEIPNSWYENLKTFKEYFLGRTKYAEQCVIENELFLEFSNPQEYILSARSSKPLEIINYALGFKITCELMNFKYDNYNTRVRYYIMTHFEKMDTADQKVMDKWEENRREAYLGSLEHFLISLKRNTFQKEGFEISTSFVPLKNGYDLYRKMIFSPDSLLSTSKSNNTSILKFEKFLQVEYKNANSKFKPISWLKIIGIDVSLDRHGFPMEIMPFEVHGSWSRSGISDMLPKYYFVEENASEL